MVWSDPTGQDGLDLRAKVVLDLGERRIVPIPVGPEKAAEGDLVVPLGIAYPAGSPQARPLGSTLDDVQVYPDSEVGTRREKSETN